ncbi:CpsD/CapB family tyrosine-protein kinase [Listeria booriae]|uniref:CpsD/CapB family tyrosine-protein kinase n=1 Tax=Listeria booriae TaxID=1552123 RepID=A0A7X0Z5T5_9LIST|nr:CpsD/CapB family tyrosine-protein kinase [Listeria booriae]MBC1551826.1 CpsD/CapB family tyrosine-protein kinase [Listeria booriae]MBC2160613.1 CpsD/CapB family tyrosine-protein kinase [Listeria booriae]MBC2176457.1 CpsD/CapB family tyrosine-protein kinase [Listeria booriae]
MVMKRKVRKNALMLDEKGRVPEQFRNIRASIQYIADKKKIKTIMATSCRQGEGKSSMIANLAMFMSKSGKRVLLIDGDLRLPTIHRIFNLKNYVGLSDLLKDDQFDKFEGIQKIDEHLDVMTSGVSPYNPSELLSDSLLPESLKAYEEIYDFIFIDAPPIGLSDSIIIANYCDATILVLENGKTTKTQLKECVEKCKMQNIDVLGIIRNKVQRRRNDSNYYYNYVKR